MKLLSSLLLVLLSGTACFAQNLTGNWAVRDPLPDGTFRTTYLDLRQEGSRITGSIRVTQFYYKIVESSGGADGFTLTGSMMDGANQRRVKYEGKLVGDDLHVSTRRRPDSELIEMVAHRAPPGEGALPPRRPIPTIHKVPDNGLAKTPPMGWNSWNKFAVRVDDTTIRQMADAMASTGMREAGYRYINIDDTWEGDRDAQGNITTNKKFPDMKALAAYVHSKDLKIGIYSSPGPNTCAGYEGSYGHEEQDARTYAAWGIDYLKYDWCGARDLHSDEEMQPLYQLMGEALLKSGRPILYSLCQYGRAEVWRWGADVGGNAWRTTGDIRDTWDSMSTIGFSQDEHARWAAPGHWNDPDMLEVGNGGMTNDEYRTHLSLWSILAAPLLAGNDLRNMSEATREILTNREVVAIDQDMNGAQGRRIARSDDWEIWAKALSNGALAIGLFNRGRAASQITIKWSDLGLKPTPTHGRDLWGHRDLKLEGAEYSVTVPAHGVVMLRVYN
jgi:alpha-galactosidase